MAILSKPCWGMDPNAGHGVASLRPEIYRKVHGSPYACERLSIKSVDRRRIELPLGQGGDELDVSYRISTACAMVKTFR